MIELRWAPFPEADVASYRVYRSIVGFRAPVVSPALGLTLQLKMNGGALQTITFDGVTNIVTKINATLTGGRAYTSIASPTYFYVRSDIREAPGSVQIVGGTAMALLGLTARTITEKSEDEVIAQVTALPDPTVVVTFQDEDGVLQDYYSLTSLDSMNNESRKTAYIQPIASSGPICVLEGIVVNLQGARVPDAEVRATIIKFPHTPKIGSYVTLEPVTVLSGVDGRFSIPLLQGTLVMVEIPAIGYSRNITVPVKAFEFITELLVDLDYRYPLRTGV